MLTALVAGVHAGRFHPRDLVDESLRRIERLNPALNAVVALRAEAARKEAELPSRRQGPLAGLPVLVKDLVATRGLPNTRGGSPLFADAPCDDHDDPTVAALVEAGAIVVGRTNSPSFGHLGVTDNPLFGPTRNPWNLARTPCGSSGGAAAALAAGLAAICTSSDGGGSTRAPAAACGLVGYKPSMGLFRSVEGARTLGSSTVGAMGRSVDDCLLEAQALLATRPGGLFAPPVGSVTLTPRRPARVIACETLTGKTLPHLGRSFEAMCALIADTLRVPLEVRRQVLSRDYVTAFEHVYNCELARTLLPYRDRWPDLEPSLRFLCDAGLKVTGTQVVEAYTSRLQIAAEIDALLGEDTVLITNVINIDLPGPSGEAPGSGADRDGGIAILEAEMEGAGNTMHFNISGHPALSVPAGIGPDGVPVGLQIVAPRWGDGLLFGLAREIEAARPWPLAAPGYAPFDLG